MLYAPAAPKRSRLRGSPASAAVHIFGSLGQRYDFAQHVSNPLPLKLNNRQKSAERIHQADEVQIADIWRHDSTIERNAFTVYPEWPIVQERETDLVAGSTHNRIHRLVRTVGEFDVQAVEPCDLWLGVDPTLRRAGSNPDVNAGGAIRTRWFGSGKP